MSNYTYFGKNITKAIEKGLEDLNLKQEDVDIKIEKQGGLFSKAKIKIITKGDFKPEKTTDKKTEKTKKEKKQSKENKKDKTIKFLEKFLVNIDPNIKYKIEENEGRLQVNIEQGKAYKLIGKRGTTIYALQHILNSIEKNSQQENKKFYIVNVDNYREKRIKSLKNLSKRISEKVLKTGKPYKLEPMNAFERKVIHSSIDKENLKTYSKGEEPNRYLVVEKINK